MSPTDYGWLVLLFPLAGTIVIGLGWRVLPAKTAGWIGTGAIFASFVSALGALVTLQDKSEEHRQLVSTAWDYANTVGVDAKLTILVDPLSVFMILVVTGVSTLIHLYSVTYLASDRGYARFFAYLNFFVFSMLLLVLAGNFMLLIVGWAFVGAASYMLISFWYRRTTATSRRHQGVRHQRARRRRARARHVLHLQAHRHAGLPSDLRQDRRGLLAQPGRPRRRLHPAPGRRVREVRPGPAPHLAPGRHGGPDPRLGPDPRRHHGHGGRVPDRAHAPALRAGAGRRGRRRDHRLPSRC